MDEMRVKEWIYPSKIIIGLGLGIKEGYFGMGWKPPFSNKKREFIRGLYRFRKIR